MENNSIQFPLKNDLIFGLVMQDTTLCKELLERIMPGRKIRELRLCGGSNTELQKTMITGIITINVRLDVLFEDDNTWFDID